MSATMPQEVLDMTTKFMSEPIKVCYVKVIPICHVSLHHLYSYTLVGYHSGSAFDILQLLASCVYFVFRSL